MERCKRNAAYDAYYFRQKLKGATANIHKTIVVGGQACGCVQSLEPDMPLYLIPSAGDRAVRVQWSTSGEHRKVHHTTGWKGGDWFMYDVHVFMQEV